MKTKISINRLAPAFASVLLSVVFLCGGCVCSNYNFGNAQSEWTIDKIEHENKIWASYHALTLDKTDLNTKNVWFEDSVGKFQIGDTLVWAKKHY